MKLEKKILELVNLGIIVSPSILSNLANPESDDDRMDSLMLQASQQYKNSLLHDKEENGSSCDDTDALLLEASQKYEAGLKDDVGMSDVEACVKTSTEEVIAVDKPSQQLKATRFAASVTIEQLEHVRKLGVPKSTKMNTRWALNAWREWVKARKSSSFVENLEKEHPLAETFNEMYIE